jgi:hypothetical protein
MMELNRFDEEDNPVYGFDVYAQRLSVYVQLSDGEVGMPVDDLGVPNPYWEDEGREYQRLKTRVERERETGVNGNGNGNGHGEGEEKPYAPRLQSLDNGSTIIIFENSQSGSVNDTLIGAREEIENRWRRYVIPAEAPPTRHFARHLPLRTSH